MPGIERDAALSSKDSARRDTYLGTIRPSGDLSLVPHACRMPAVHESTNGEPLDNSPRLSVIATSA